VLLDLLWVDGLTIRNLHIRRPGYWTVKPTFCSNVVIRKNVIDTWNPQHAGSNTDGVDIDSSWNCWISLNRFSTGDDCISLKAGRDWSGRLVNISTVNVLAEQNEIIQGHGITIGSETAGWIRNVTIRDSAFGGAVRTNKTTPSFILLSVLVSGPHSIRRCFAKTGSGRT
jgi:polygalacturonase